MISGHVFIATSLDGFIARNDGGIDWLSLEAAADENHGYDEFMKDIDGIIMGRGTYEKVITFEPWPYSTPVVVLSRKLAGTPIPANLEGRVRFMDSSPSETMRLMAEDGWKKAYIDGGQIIQSFLRENLIADMTISRIPVLLGEGRPLFGPLREDVPLIHVKTKAFPSGIVQTVYRVSTWQERN